MKHAILVSMAVTVMCLSCSALGQGVPTTAPGWDPAQFQLAMNGPCKSELAETAALIKMRDSGLSRAASAKALPAEINASASVTESILDDVYENPDIAYFPYFAYRNITCMRRHTKKPTPASLTSVAPQVMACQRKFGTEASDHLISCIQRIVAGGN